MKLKIRVLLSVLSVFTLMVLGILCASAKTPVNEGLHYYINCDKIDEVLAGQAGEKTTVWEVPYLYITPTLDGTISKGEYMPFEMYEDYLSYMACNVENTEEDFNQFYEMTKDGFFDAYWGWDGTYMYVAFEVRCVNGFICTPEDLGGSVYLYAYNMLQIGIAPVDATGKDPAYVELGYGVHSETGESLAHTWAGPFYPNPGEDFVGQYIVEDQTVIYEARIHLQTALGLTDRTVQNGDQINYGWLVSANGESTGVYDYWQVGFTHGIGGQYSHKVNEYLARVTFAGLPDDANVEVETIPNMSEEDKLYDLKEFVDMSNESIVKTFKGEEASIEYVTEGDMSFMRITSVGDTPYVWSDRYPRNMQSADVKYIVVRYRSSSDVGEELGILYRNYDYPTYDLDDLYSETIGNDGEWHTVVFWMDGEPRWVNWIVNMGLAPFADSSNSAGRSIDIAYVKFYAEDPSDLVEDEVYDPSENEETTAAEDDTDPTIEETTAAEADTDPALEETTVADTNATINPETEPADKEGGCASTVTVGALLLCLLGSVALIKRRED